MESLRNNKPRVSIIIPVRNAERTIDTTIEYLKGIDYPKECQEIIIADGGSTDRTLQIVEQWIGKLDFIKLVEVPNCSSPGHARNAALKVATGEFVLFTDGDCAPNPAWIDEIIRPFEADPLIGGVGGEVLTLRTEATNITEAYCEQTGFLSVSGRCGIAENGYFPGLTDRAPHEVNGGNYSPFFATANVAFRKSIIDEIGGEFWAEPTGEDVDFSLRILQRGYRLYFAKSAVVRHMHRVSLENYLKQWYGYGFGHPLLIDKHAADQLEILLQFEKPVSLKLPSPVKGIVHIGAFHLMHLSLAIAITSGTLAPIFPALLPLSLASAVTAAASAGLYFAPCLKLRPASRFPTWCKIRYLTNWAFIRGAIDGCKKFGTICIEPSW
ncbi:MAG: glycosyltransferase [Chloroflexi bacterium]|nr:glycosyltransferase [Chloroflexota bacterium]